MKQLTKILCLTLALCLCFGCAASAASGESVKSSRLVTVSGGSMNVNKDGSYTLEGELGIDAKNVSGIRFVAGSIGQSFLSVSNSTHVDPAADGFNAIVGSDEELFNAPNLAEVYSNDDLNPNCEGFDLDYGWIGVIDWNEASKTYGAYTPVTERGRALWGEIYDGKFSNVIVGGSAEGESANRGPTQLSCSGGAALLVKNTYIYSEGLEGLAISNNGSADVGSTMVVKDSLFVTRGYVPASVNTSENLPNDPLLVTGADRTNLSGGESVTYYYDSAALVDGWASLSTDGASGEGVDFIAVNTIGSALLGGYGTYADGNCRDYLYGSVLEGAEIGAIIAGSGEISVFDGDEGIEGGTGCRVGLNGDLDPYAFADEDALESYKTMDGSVVAGGRWGVLMHVAGSAAIEPQGLFYARDSAVITDKALYADADTEYSVNASWYGRELSPNIQKYIEYTEGADILLRGTNARIVLDGATLESYSGVLIQSVLNNDTSTPATPAGSNAAGTEVHMVDMAASGEIRDEDYERVMRITLDNTVLTGSILSGTCASWTGKWLAMGYAEDYTVGYASNTFGKEEPLDAFVHALSFADNGLAVYTPYGDDQGTELTLENGAVWNVTAESTLTALSIDNQSTVNGIMTVDGVETPVEAGSYTGHIVLMPAA